jgi:hypothetical protein
MATNASELQKYFADIDAAEEADAKLAGVTPDEFREATLPSKGPLAALGRATWEAEDLRRARSAYAKRGMDLPEHLRVKEAFEAQPIPIASAPARADVPAPTTGVIAPTTSTQPAPPAGTSSTVKPPPVDAGSGGDDELGRLSMGQALVRALEGSGSVISGQNLRSGAADTLGERMKQIEALRAKRQEKEITDAQEVANNKAQVDYLISRFPEQTDSLTKLYGMTRKANFPQFVRLEEQIALDRARAKTEGVKPEVALRGAEVKEGTLEERITHNRATEAIARAAAALAAERAAKPAAEERGIKPEALTNRLKDLNAQTKPFQEIVSSLKEADAALSALGTGQLSLGAKAASKIPLIGQSLVSTPELRALQGQEGLKQSYQKLKTGLAAVGQELASFENQFGLNWYADPRKAPLAVETLKQITQDALRRTQAPFGAGTGNAAIDQMEVLSLLRNTGGLTSEDPVFRPNPTLQKAAGMTSPTTAGPAPSPAPTTIQIRRKSDGKTKTVPAAVKAKWLANPDFEEVS